MSVEALLHRYGGRAGGLMIYNAAKASAKLINVGKHHLPLYGDTKPRLQWLFPTVDMDRVVVVKSAKLPANWFESPNTTDAMTFGWEIYAKSGNLQYEFDGLMLLIHELVHVKQIRDLGEAEFARRYGDQLLKSGYANMPLENEARSYVANLPFDISYYRQQNPDVQTDDVSTFAHWLDDGIREGRPSAANFHVKQYLEKNADLLSAGFDNFAAVRHWIEYGHAENRVST